MLVLRQHRIRPAGRDLVDNEKPHRGSSGAHRPADGHGLHGGHQISRSDGVGQAGLAYGAGQGQFPVVVEEADAPTGAGAIGTGAAVPRMVVVVPTAVTSCSTRGMSSSSSKGGPVASQVVLVLAAAFEVTDRAVREPPAGHAGQVANAVDPPF
jgi:hypothetical protein